MLLGGLLALPACATSSVPRLNEEPRTTEVPGTGVFVWRETSGWVRPDRGRWGKPDHVRSESFRAYQAKRYADALWGFLTLENMQSAGGGRARGDGQTGSINKDLNFYVGECYFHLGNYDKALQFYRRVYRQDFPAQDLLDQALKRVFEIGMAYVKGEVTCEFLGIPYKCEQHGISILADPSTGLLTEYPMLSFSDVAWIEIAKYYFEEKEYAEAVPIYERVASNPESEWADLAEYQAALSIYSQVRGVDYDQRTIQDAYRRFTRYLENHRRGEHAEAAREKLREISEMEGAKNLRIAKFYLRESQPDACELYLKRVLTHYPNSTAAREAREIQGHLDRIKSGA